MKCAVIFAEGIKQICLTPENDEEKAALSMFSLDDEIYMKAKMGSFGEPDRPFGYKVSECQGGYLRRWEEAESLMLVLRPKGKESDNS